VKLYARGDWAKRGPYIEVPDSLPAISSDASREEVEAFAADLVASGAMTREAADRLVREWGWTDEEREAEARRRGEWP
jgi:hypothetical protein